MRIGPKYKISRRLGSPVFDKCQTQKFALSEEKRKKRKISLKRPKQMSDFGRQLIEKQKVRYTYGIVEKQLYNYVKEAASRKDLKPSVRLIENLESRLDNVVYRLGLAKSRRMARQIVSHGHITINGKKVTIPSYKVLKGMKIKVREGSKNSFLFVDIKEKLKDYKTPLWISFNEKILEGEIKDKPSQDAAELLFDISSVLEFYSK